MTSPIDVGSSVIETVRVPARSGIVEEIIDDEEGIFHARVVDKGTKDRIGDYFWSPVLQLRKLESAPVKTINIVELGEILKENNLSVKIKFHNDYFQVKFKMHSNFTGMSARDNRIATCLLDCSAQSSKKSLAGAITSALNKLKSKGVKINGSGCKRK